MKKIIFIAFLNLAFATLTSAQNREQFTYRDLLIQQKSERAELIQTQMQIINAVLLQQKEEIHTSNFTSDTETRNKNERQLLVDRLTTEREKLMTIQAEERKRFQLNSPNINKGS